MTARVEELWLLGGVTASGKTQMALEWAEKNNAEILSCDSVSFYRGLDVGSAKPDSMDQRRVVHHGLDLAGVSEVFDVSKFHSYAEEAVEEIASRGKRVLVVGGSGFFLHGFLKPVVDGLDISDEVRDYVLKRYEDEGIEAIIEELKKLNPQGLPSLTPAAKRSQSRDFFIKCLGASKKRVFRAQNPLLPNTGLVGIGWNIGQGISLGGSSSSKSH